MRLIDADAIYPWYMDAFDFDPNEVRFSMNDIRDNLDNIPTHQTPSNTLGSLDCVDRQAAIDALKSQLSDWNDDYNIPVRKSIENIERLPSAQPQKGKWIKDNPHSEIYRYACSECHARHRARYDFCPSCGADMRSEAREYLEYGKLIAKGIAQGLRGDSDEN